MMDETGSCQGEVALVMGLLMLGAVGFVYAGLGQLSMLFLHT
ncbi:MAG: hypothetical protein JWM80_4728 [Cyanobacteria bacterium RYN_339]|nr:hypothetical protein [Cyanobacteria bacterium RYN_339]